MSEAVRENNFSRIREISHLAERELGAIEREPVGDHLNEKQILLLTITRAYNALPEFTTEQREYKEREWRNALNLSIKKRKEENNASK